MGDRSIAKPMAAENAELGTALIDFFEGLEQGLGTQAFSEVEAARFCRLALIRMSANCRACAAGGRETWADPADVAASEGEQRGRFLLRLVMAKISGLFHVGGHRGALPRSIIDGIDRYLGKLLGQIVYDDLNAISREVIEAAGPYRSDEELVAKVMAMPAGRRFLVDMLARILVRFEHYERARKTAVNIINTRLTPEQSIDFRTFDLVFGALFDDVFDIVRSDEGERIRLDYMIGDGASRTIVEIREQRMAGGDGAAPPRRKPRVRRRAM
jgi:hypothetical protein